MKTPKREPEAPRLLAWLAVCLLALAFAFYLIMNATYYKDHPGEPWKEFWLPALTSMVATLITFLIAYLVLRANHNNAKADQAELVAERVLDIIDDKLRNYSSNIKHEALVEVILLIYQQAQRPSGVETQSSESIKENAPAGTRVKRASSNK